MSTFLRLLGFLRPYRRGAIASLVLAMLAMVGTVAIPWLTGRAVDAIERGDREDLKLFALVVLGAAAAVAAIVGEVRAGAVWGSPLSDLVWALDAAILLQTIVALPIAVVLGTPGCEIGVWGDIASPAP